jgi:anaerobic magnesium-protoporphyrin IX monomethyl ester cyclase
MTIADCLILGFYDYPFADYVSLVEAMGTDSGAYQDVSLAFIEYQDKPMHALDALNYFFNEGHPKSARQFHNADFLWPAVAYLTAYLRRRGHSVEYVNLPHFEADKLRATLQAGVRAVVITTTVYVSPHPILELVGIIRRYGADVKIVIGGPFIANEARQSTSAELYPLLAYLGGDVYVLCSEGEATLSTVLNVLKSDGSLNGVPNLAFRDQNGEFAFTEQVLEKNDLTENIINYSQFRRSDIGEFVSLRTAKSCPFSCAFCGFPQRAGKYMYMGVQDVERLLDALADIGGVTTVSFIDDTFNVPKKRFREILRLLIAKEYGFRWNCFYRCDHGDEETIELMARAGCEGVFLGVESGSDAMLLRMNKTARRRDYVTAIPLLKAAGISTYASFIIGFPGETDETVRETIDLVEETAPEYFRAQLWYADPITPIWLERDVYALDGIAFNWSHSTMNARRACDWINRIFLETRNSTWLPQFGFEQWSTFYLARHGMTRDQIRTFIESFNSLIKHRLLTSGDSPPAHLLEHLRLNCQFDRGQRTISAGRRDLAIEAR